MQQNNKSQKRKGGWPWSKEPVVDPNAPVVDPNAPVVDPNAPVETNKGFLSSWFNPIKATGGKKRRNKSNKRSKKSKRNQSRKR